MNAHSPLAHQEEDSDPNIIPEAKPGHLFPEFLPEDVSLSYAMNKDNLYAVWYLETEFRKSLGAPDMSMDFSLADQDPFTALAQMKQAYHPTEILAVMSVASLEKLAEKITTMTKVPLFDHIKKTYQKIYFVEKDQKKYWSNKKEGTVLFAGKLSDVTDLVKKGQDILAQKNYDAVFIDVRPIEPGHPKDWLHFMRDAEASLADRFDRLMYNEKDGTG